GLEAAGLALALHPGLSCLRRQLSAQRRALARLPLLQIGAARHGMQKVHDHVASQPAAATRPGAGKGGIGAQDIVEPVAGSEVGSEALDLRQLEEGRRPGWSSRQHEETPAGFGTPEEISAPLW